MVNGYINNFTFSLKQSILYLVMTKSTKKAPAKMAMKPVAGKAMKMPMMGKSMMKKMTVKKSAKAKM